MLPIRPDRDPQKGYTTPRSICLGGQKLDSISRGEDCVHQGGALHPSHQGGVPADEEEHCKYPTGLTITVLAPGPG